MSLYRIFSILIGAILLCCSCFSDDGRLSKGPDENFFDYVCRIKILELDKEETDSCRQFVQGPQCSLSPYLETLQTLFKEQLMARMGSAAAEAPDEFLDRKASKLMKIFLKEKLGMQKKVTPEHDLAKRAQWDPHYHGSSLFADHFPKARLFLPNYEEAYAYMKVEHRKLNDRAPFIKRAMEDTSFAMITEAGSGYDSWHFDHAGKRIIPILAHYRYLGPAHRHDVLGYDICGLEQEDRYEPQTSFFESLQENKVVRMHMGETILPEKGKEHVRLLLDEAEKSYTSSKPLRIGHGTHISIEDMIRVAQKGYYIEACLTSNKKTGILDKRSDYPLGVMLLLGVHVVIGTDGGRLYGTTLPEEYAYAVRNLQKFHAKLKHSNECVRLPNGDYLRYKHILPYVREKMKKRAVKKMEKAITYKELRAYLEPSVIERISSETLVFNANALLELCYPHIHFGTNPRRTNA